MKWLSSRIWRSDLLSEDTISSRLIFEGRIIKLRVDTVRVAGGGESTREIVEHSDCVAIIAMDDRDNILLVNQFRKPVEKALLEIPAGGIDTGESAADAVRREMQEETGYLPQRVERLGGFYSTPGFCTEYLHLYLASELVPSTLFAEDTEGIEIVRIRPDQVTGLIADGTICDAKSIAGLLIYLRHMESAKPAR
jgi:ADP-ribose pyrophosphatase